MIETRTAYDVDIEKLAELYRQIANDIANGDAPVKKFETTRDVDAERGDVHLNFGVTVAEWSDTTLFEQASDVYEDDIE
jgi:hypothetical protein